MAFTERGSGDPLICIMGVTAPGASLGCARAGLGETFPLHPRRQPRRGRTDKPEGPYTTAIMADDYAGLHGQARH